MKRPLGITLIAGLLIFIGAMATLFIFIEIIDALRFGGFKSIMIIGPMSMLGFLIYGVTPILFYSTGVGLFMGRPWSRKAVMYCLPVFIILYFFNFACTAASERYYYSGVSMLDLIAENGRVFLNYFVRSILVIVPLLYYFRIPKVVEYFNE